MSEREYKQLQYDIFGTVLEMGVKGKASFTKEILKTSLKSDQRDHLGDLVVKIPCS